MRRTGSWAAGFFGRPAAVWLLGVALCTMVLLVVGALNLASTQAEARSEATTQPVVVLPSTRVPVDLERFALNALLVPLLDDAQPPRWTRVSIDHYCGAATQVTVDGRPMRPDTPIPATSFTLRWQMDRCAPMGFETLEMSGAVELLVFHEDDGLSAVIAPQQLMISTPSGRSWMKGPFAARMLLGTPDLQPGTAARPGE
jgi:hypothetical protein